MPDHNVLFGASLGQWNGTGSVGPKSLAVTGQLSDGWIPPGGAHAIDEPPADTRPRGAA